MKRSPLIALVLTALSASLIVGMSTAGSATGDPIFMAVLTGFEEVPAVSTTAAGEFRAKVSGSGPGAMIDYELTYDSPESPAQAAHIHLGQKGANGGVSAFLCGGMPPMSDKPPCPPIAGTVTGTIDAPDVIGPSGQGIDPGQIDELIAAMRAGMTYANVHTSARPGGEVRGQIK